MPTPPPPNPQADAWDAYVKAGVPPDSATALVNSKPTQADAWDRLTNMGVKPDAAKALVDTHVVPIKVSEAAMHPSTTESNLVHAADGITFGMGPKAAAAIQSLVTGSKYSDIRDAQNAAMGAQVRDHPWASGIGSVEGGLLPAVLSDGATVPEAIEGATARTAYGGGVFGAADAAGHSDGPLADRLKATAIGAGGGALTAGLLGGTIAGVKAVGRPLISGAAQVAKAIEESGGMKAVQAALDHLTSTGRGDVASLADLSQPLRDLADHSATVSGPAREAIADVTTGRQATQGARAIQDVRDGLGDVPNAPELSATMKTALQKWAESDQGYGGIRAANPPVDARAVQAAMDKPQLVSAWKDAQLADNIAPNDPVKGLLAKVTADNPGWSPEAVKTFASDPAAQGVYGGGAAAAGDTRAASYTDLSRLNKLLDGRVGKAYSAGDVPLAENYKSIRDLTRDALNQVPDHAAVTEQYAARKGAIDALALGEQDFGTTDVRGIQRRMGALPADQQELYRQGMASKFSEWLSSKGANRDVGTELANASPDMQAKIKTVFGDPQTFQDYTDAQASEKSLSQLKATTTGAPTAKRILKATSVLSAGAGGMAAMLHSPTSALAAGTLGAGMYGAQKAMEHAAGDAGNMLATQGGDAIQQLLDQISQQGAKPLMSQLGQGVAAGVGGAVGGPLSR